MCADHIVAQPLTITASIGVINAKISTDGIYESRDIMRVNITKGANANISKTVGTWNDEQRAIVENNMNRVYDLFKSHVKAARQLKEPDLEKIAGGRVFLGRQAKDNGLVDQLGGLVDAIEKAAEMAEIDDIFVEVMGEDKKLLPPENILQPETYLNFLNQISGKNLLLPYYILSSGLE